MLRLFNVQKKHSSGGTVDDAFLTRIRTYGEFLLLGLLLIHILAFLAYRWVETNETRSEIEVYRREINLGSEFFERDNDYNQEVPSQNSNIEIESRSDVNKESGRVAIILVCLYIGEVLLLFSWWIYLKENIHVLFKS